MTEMVTNPVDYTRQFWFSIDEIDFDGFSGSCYSYDVPTPPYQIFLKNGHRVYATDTSIEGEIFSASTDLDNEIIEILVNFAGVGKVTTDTYIQNGEVRYVNPFPAVEPEDKIIEGAILRA